MKIKAVQCLDCGDIIYSRARHDFRYCSCRNIAVDGGFDYNKLIYKDFSQLKHIDIEVEATKADLYNDWNNRIGEYGQIKGKTKK